MARVLIIEDSPSQAQIMAQLVQQAGHESAIATDISKGVAQTVMALQPDIVLLDLVLMSPQGKAIADGFQLCREIKRISANKIGVIIVTSKGDQESAEWAIMQGADAFLQKPFVVEDLMQVMGDILGL